MYAREQPIGQFGIIHPEVNYMLWQKQASGGAWASSLLTYLSCVTHSWSSLNQFALSYR